MNVISAHLYNNFNTWGLVPTVSPQHSNQPIWLFINAFLFYEVSKGKNYNCAEIFSRSGLIKNVKKWKIIYSQLDIVAVLPASRFN